MASGFADEPALGQVDVATVEDELQLEIAVVGLCPETKTTRPAKDAPVAKRRKLTELDELNCLLEVEVRNSQKKTLYRHIRASLAGYRDDATSTFTFRDGPFMVPGTDLLVPVYGASGQGWVRSLIRNYTVTIRILFQNDHEMNQALELMSLRATEEEVILTGSFEAVVDPAESQSKIHRFQLQKYTIKSVSETGLSMTTRTRWIGTPLACRWCGEGKFFPTAALRERHYRAEHICLETLDLTADPTNNSMPISTTKPDVPANAHQNQSQPTAQAIVRRGASKESTTAAERSQGTPRTTSAVSGKRASSSQTASFASTGTGTRDDEATKLSRIGVTNPPQSGTRTVKKEPSARRVIPGSPSILEESLADAPLDLRVDSGVELDEASRSSASLTKSPTKATESSAVQASNSTTSSHSQALRRPKTSIPTIEQPESSTQNRIECGLPPHDSREYKVPSLTDDRLHVFEETTMRLLTAGMSIGTSESKIDETWLRMKQDQKIDAISEMSTTQQSLMKRWNHQLFQEKLNGNKFLPDAVLRFVAGNKSWLEDDLAFREFMRLLGALRADKLLADETIEACVDKLRGIKLSSKEPKRSITTRSRASLGASGSRQAAAAAAAVKRASPRVPDLAEKPYILETRSTWATTCVCGETVDGSGRIVLCSNPVR